VKTHFILVLAMAQVAQAEPGDKPNAAGQGIRIAVVQQDGNPGKPEAYPCQPMLDSRFNAQSDLPGVRPVRRESRRRAGRRCESGRDDQFADARRPRWPRGTNATAAHFDPRQLCLVGLVYHRLGHGNDFIEQVVMKKWAELVFCLVPFGFILEP